MTTRRLPLLTAAILIGLTVALAAGAATSHATPRCLRGIAPFQAPDDACTPGAFQRLTKAQVCQSKDRPTLKAADRREILRRYGLTTWSGIQGELDHRQPFALGGTTDPRNVWPQAGVLPNPKDKLEAYVLRRVCAGKPHPMRLTTAHRIFAGNWVAYFRFYHLGA